MIVFDIFSASGAATGTLHLMATWNEFDIAAPELAAQVKMRLDAHVHKTLATLRSDGSPRISGTEVRFADGDLWIGSMWQARKARDLQRDPRFALHTGSDDPPAWTGDAKLAGTAEEIIDPERLRAISGADPAGRPSHLFRLELTEVSTVGLNATRDDLVIDLWTPTGGIRRIKGT